MPPGGRPDDRVRRGAATRGRAGRVLPRPVHLRRARNRLARQQQHRGVDLQPDGSWSGIPSRPGSWSGPGPAGPGRRSGATPASGGFATRMCVVDPENSIFYSAVERRAVDVHRPSVTHRGHRAPASRAEVPAGHRRPDDPGSGRRLDRDDAHGQRAHRPQRRRLHRHQRVGAFLLVAEMLSRGEQGSVVTLICDGGDRYAGTYTATRGSATGLDLAPHTERARDVPRPGAFPAVGAR